MKRSLLALFVVLGVGSFTMLYTGGEANESEPRLPAVRIDSTIQDSTGGTDVIRMPAAIGEVVFPHREHIEDMGIACQECHHEIKAAALHTPHDQYFKDFWIKCSICHREGEAPREGAIACSECHHERPNGIADQTLSSKVVIHEKCWDCHDVGTGAEASGECEFCHSGEKAPYKYLDLNQ
jgi:Cytochrome c7 and related cytochrome c